MIKLNRNIFYVLLIVIVILILLLFNMISNKLKPYLLTIATDEGIRLSNIIVNDAVKKEIGNDISFDKLFITTENNNVSTIDFDTIVVNRLLVNITNDVLLNLKYVENGEIDKLDMLVGYNKNKLRKGIIYEVPLTNTYNNIFLTNLSPRIPIRIRLVGNIDSSISTKITNYGINNSLVEVYINISINLQMVLPILSNRITTKSSIPLALKLVHGKIPNYFSNNGSMNYSIPIE